MITITLFATLIVSSLGAGNLKHYIIFHFNSSLVAQHYLNNDDYPTSGSSTVNLSSYAPVRVACPPDQHWVRPADGLSDEEAAWVRGRKPKVLDGLDAYLHAPCSSYTNYSGFQEIFTKEQMAAILTNGFNYATQGNSTLDAEWPECLGCAAIDRSLARVGMQRTEHCQSCMTRYCWDGREDNRTPGVVDHVLHLDPDVSFSAWNKSYPYWPIVI